MIQITIKSKKTGREITASYTARQLLNTNEEQVVEEMTACNCEPVGESNVIECSCSEDWIDYEMVLQGRDEKY